MNREDQMVFFLLTALSEDSRTTQSDLATRLGVGVGLVNSYLKRVIYKGYVKTKQLERRRLLYLITPSGLKEKTRLTYEFLRYSYQYIREVRRKAHEVMLPFAREGKKRVVFYGSGEVAELAYLAVRELGMELVGVVDPDNAGDRCVDHRIRDLDWLENEGEHADVLLVLNGPASDADQAKRVKEIAQHFDMEYAICM